MKYTSKIKSAQTIQIGDGKSIRLVPGKGSISDAEALAVAKSPWGKRLIETGYLTFDKKIKVPEEKVERGMTVKSGERKGKKPAPASAAEEEESASGDDTASAEAIGNDTEVPDFDHAAQGDGGE